MSISRKDDMLENGRPRNDVKDNSYRDGGCVGYKGRFITFVYVLPRAISLTLISFYISCPPPFRGSYALAKTRFLSITFSLRDRPREAFPPSYPDLWMIGKAWAWTIPTSVGVYRHILEYTCMLGPICNVYGRMCFPNDHRGTKTDGLDLPLWPRQGKRRLPG